MLRPYTRSLDPQDYSFLPHAEPLRQYERVLKASGVAHRDWCEHRLWEYASMMQQLDELQISEAARIIDTGSGGSFFPPYLATHGFPNLELTDWVGVLEDGMNYGDCRPDVEAQRMFSGAALPLHLLLLEDMSVLATGTYDIAMCISSIEHVPGGHHDAALRELCRITKPGGYLFITSDYFRDLDQWHASPSKFMQHTPYTKEFVLNIPSMINVEFVGATDLDYRGDFVHNHSFVNICLRKLG
jgi:SAM-dependent methyltransferase